MSARQTRGNLELCPIDIKQRILNNHDGSAIFSFGNIKALATVSGPSEVRIRDELTDQSTLDIHYTPLQGIPGITALAFSTALIDTFSHVLLLHLHPRSLIQINLQTYSSPSTYSSQPLLHRNQKLKQPKISPPHPDAPIPVSLQAAHINAISVACLDAGIHMQSIVIASSAVIARRGIRENFMKGWKAGETLMYDEDTDDDSAKQAEFEVLLDPSPYEESLSKSRHVFAFAFTRDIKTDTVEGKLVYNDSRGSHSSRDYFDVTSLCREASKNILEIVRTIVSQSL